MINKTITTFIKKHGLLMEDTTVLVGVSGGPDSMALLHFLHSIREEWNLQLIAISVDHQLRGDESKADMDYVRHICDQWNITFIGTSVDVPSYKIEKHLGTQLAARELRYQFFEQQMKYHDAAYLALGHHGDDQVETMLMSLVRTADSSAFSGIPVKRNFAAGHIIRPLLCVSKEQILTYCLENRIAPRIDPTNHETEYTRNYFRKYLLPLIKEKNSNIHNTVQYLSETLQEDESYLRQEASKLVDRTVVFHAESKQASFEISLFKTHSYALQRRAFHLILNYLYDDLPGSLSYIHEQDFFALLKSDKSNVQIDFPSNLKLEKSYEKMVIYFAEHHDSSYHKTLEIPGEIKLPDGSMVRADYVSVYSEQNEQTYICEIEQVALPLHIRTRQRGDRMRWKGLDGSKKIKDIFIDAKVPRKDRNKWPILIDNNGEVLWLIGLKKGQPEKEVGRNASYIRVHYENGSL
ncbi:tRNA lysidine(34) synthetase TilS [Virgibacillus sp. C22-A2]|uniref:tRNA(Ile)-lysidine synthase n=1 Tax=Virgibacillus tibetensis TaxID=3042313 RepID=A0ABU6KN48_9BACI|nr:tRNA lysidine(34) synthetase TilS [Virgibacillus sp. C22-A2]